jgi:hypothetical protein
MHACKERTGKNRKEMTKQHATQIRAKQHQNYNVKYKTKDVLFVVLNLICI